MEDAQSWFTGPLTEVSQAFDDRETEASRRLAAAVSVFLAGAPRTVLDVGCGTGGVLRHLRRYLPTADLIGVDPSLDAIRACRLALRDLPEITLHQCGAEDLEPAMFPTAVELAVSHLNLGLWRDPVRGLSRIIGCLAPGGYCYIVDLAATDDDQLTRLAHTADERTYLHEQLSASYSVGELRSMVAHAGDAAGRRIQTHVGLGGLSGYRYDDPVAARLWSDKRVQEALSGFDSDPAAGWKADFVLYATIRRVDAR